jgi:hypothetical protein
MCRQVMGRPATRAASCLAADSGRTASGRVRLASARSCVPLGMRSITTGVSHLRSRSFIGPPIAYNSVGCSWLRRRIRDALHLLACPGWPALIRRPEVPCTPEKGSNRPCTSSLARIGDTAQSVRASDTSNCRYQHAPAPWQTSKGKKRTPLVLLVGTPKFPLDYLVHRVKPNPADWPRHPSYNTRACFCFRSDHLTCRTSKCGM